MNSTAPLTESEVVQLVKEWFHKLDVHAPMVEMLPLLVDDGLEMVFPEVTVHGHAGFEGWYQRVIHEFFDEAHMVEKVEAAITPEQADVKVVVHWQTSVWKPPAAYSSKIDAYAGQHWVVKRSPATGKPIITSYIVESFKEAEGSAGL